LQYTKQLQLINIIMAKDIGWPKGYTMTRVNTWKHRKINSINGVLMTPVAPCETRDRKGV